MAKTKISEFDSTPANNTDIDSINIAEGCAPSGINNAIRELMSQLKDQQTGAAGDNFTVGGNLVVNGTSVHTGATTFTGAVVLSTALPVASGGTGATTLTGYVKGAGTAALTGSATVPTTDITGTLPVANGGTGLTATPTNGQLNIGNGTGFTRAALTAGSGISITNGAGSISIAATGGGTVTSVATGNGLSGGTITSTGTLVVACPGFNTVGSYAMTSYRVSGTQMDAGSNYSAGYGNTQLGLSALITLNQNESGFLTGSISGTWKLMSASANHDSNGVMDVLGLACRVS